jgi:hypothetical protein
MLMMAAFACHLAIAIPDQIFNVFISVFSFYLVSTAWLTVRRKHGLIGLPERIALLLAIVLCAPFAILAFQLATSLSPLFKSAVPLTWLQVRDSPTVWRVSCRVPIMCPWHSSCPYSFLSPCCCPG